MPMSCHRVEHQNGSDPPPVFLLVSISTGIVHCLSGPTTTTKRSPTAPEIAPSPRRCGSLLGPCFNTGPSPRLLSCIFTFHPLDAAFSQFPRGTYSLSDSPPCLALDASTTPSRCTTRQHYSLPALAPGLSPAAAALSIASSALRHNARGLSTGAPSFSVAPTPEIHVCFFSWP